VRLLQFTDTHLTGSPRMPVRGVAPGETLARCLAHAERQHPDPRAILLTGDLVHDDVAGYGELCTLFAGAGAPVHCLPGNHDTVAAMRRGLDCPPFVHGFAHRHDAWLIAMLDSTVAGEDHGHLPDEQLERLDRVLALHSDAWALICLHHHPVPHGSRWLDELMLDNAAALFTVLARHPRVRGLTWGHTHQPLDDRRGDLRLMGTPSTCMQFAQNADEFEVDTRPPAYRWFTLGTDGGLETGIEWVTIDD
jgi:3',5'-cyclic-AMP phosphodiesterase